jgi:hypothetical protein
MAKPRKRAEKATKVSTRSNSAATEIIPDERKLVINESRRRSGRKVQANELVTVRNKLNGAVNKMAAFYAVKLVSRSAETYEILK